MAKPKVQMSEKGTDPGQVLWTLLRPITHTASLAVGFTALAYALGWGYLSGFFKEAGALWVLSTLDTTQVLQISLSNLITFALFAGVLFFLYSDGLVRLKGLAILLAALVVMLLVGLIIHYGFGAKVPAKVNSAAVTAFIVSGFFLIPTIFIVAIAIVVEKRVKTEKVAPIIYGYFLLAIVAIIPARLGKWVAEEKFAGPGRYKFPTVELIGEASCKWGLVRAVSGGNLLLAMPGERGKPLFRLVAFEKVTQVSNELPQRCTADPNGLPTRR